jgi:hypothetical protein
LTARSNERSMEFISVGRMSPGCLIGIRR